MATGDDTIWQHGRIAARKLKIGDGTLSDAHRWTHQIEDAMTLGEQQAERIAALQSQLDYLGIAADAVDTVAKEQRERIAALEAALDELAGRADGYLVGLEQGAARIAALEAAGERLVGNIEVWLIREPRSRAEAEEAIAAWRALIAEK
jgi:hypothetical protein